MRFFLSPSRHPREPHYKTKRAWRPDNRYPSKMKMLITLSPLVLQLSPTLALTTGPRQLGPAVGRPGAE